MKINTCHKTHSSQMLATLLCIDTAIYRVGYIYSENALVHTVFSLLLCKACPFSFGNGLKQRRAERCGSFLGG